MSNTRAVFLSLVLEANDGGYLASVPGLQGAFAEGDTVEEAIFNCIDVVKLIAAYRAERGETLGFNEVELTPATRITIAIPNLVLRSCAQGATHFDTLGLKRRGKVVVTRETICSIIPPHMLKEIAKNGMPHQQACAWHTLSLSEQFRGQRLALTWLASFAATAAGEKRRTIYNAQNQWRLPGRLVRGEGNPKSHDLAVNEAYNGSGAVYDFFKKIYKRNSLDDKGMRLDSSVHYGEKYDNAFWNGRQMVYGDGDGELFGRFTKALDVIGHELSHGVIQFEADLLYQGQPGALNESYADIFGSLIKQYRKRQTAEEADWLIGAGLFTKKVKGQALRSMKAPGTAYDDPILGKDPQPAHIRDYVKTEEDNGGVHINSGIPNKAFYEAAIRLGGYAWEKAGRIWYIALVDRLSPEATFEEAAKATFSVAGELFGEGSKEQRAVRDGWEVVGVKIKGGRRRR